MEFKFLVGAELVLWFIIIVKGYGLKPETFRGFILSLDLVF